MDSKLDLKVHALIEAIRLEPCLYDQTDVRYRDIAYKNSVWAAITEKTGFEDIHKAQSKWTYLKDKYVKCKRKLRQKDATGEVTWPYFTDMTWLDDFRPVKEQQPSTSENREYDLVENIAWATTLQQVIDAGSPERPESREAEATGEPPAKLAKYDPEETARTPEDRSIEHQEPHTASAQQQPQTQQIPQHQVMETPTTVFIQQPASQLPEDSEEELFCRSISKALARLSPRSRRIARIRIEQVLFDLEFPEQSGQVNSQHNHNHVSSNYRS